jgi:hypothetical protein
LNPDEQVWNYRKGRLAKVYIDSAATLRQSILNVMRSLQKQAALIRSFFAMKDTCYAVM